MPTVDLTPYNQPQNSTSDGSKFDNLIATIQAAFNGGIDDANIAVAAAIAISKLAGYPADATKVPRGNGTWGNISPVLDFASRTTLLTVTAVSEGTAATVITGNSVTYDGSRCKVEFFLPEIAGSGAIGVVFVLLRDAVVLGHVAGIFTSSSDEKPVYGSVYDTPSAGAHTYSLAAYVSSGNASLFCGPGGAGQLVPGTLTVSRG